MSSTGFMRVFFRGWQGAVIAMSLMLLFLPVIGWSGWFIRPQSITVTPARTILVRTLPLGDVRANWVMEVTRPDGHECPAATGVANMQAAKNDTVVLDIPPGVAPCVVPGAVVNITYEVKFMGIPLWPRAVTTIVGE